MEKLLVIPMIIVFVYALMIGIVFYVLKIYEN